MTTKYIVKIQRDSELIPSDEIDGYAVLKSSNGYFGPTISLQTKEDMDDPKNIVILNKYISKDFAELTIVDADRTIALGFKEYFGNNRKSYKIIFDKNSKSSFNQFKKDLTTMMSTTNQTIYYPSGNEKYVGNVSNIENKSSMNGSGTLYYDNMNHDIKYTGEFEDGNFDGAGRFQNKEGNLVLVANNISNGIPVQKGKLFVNFRDLSKVIEVNFLDFWSKIEIDSKLEKKRITKSDRFVKVVASVYLDGKSKSLDKLLFKDKPEKDQNVELWEQIKGIRTDIIRMEFNNRENQKENINMVTMLGFVSVCSLMLNFFLLIK